MTSTNILVVNCSGENFITLQSLAKNSGNKMLFATSYDEALSFARKKGVKIVLIDVEMQGISGFEFVETLRLNPQTKNLPVIFLIPGSEAFSYTEKDFGPAPVDFLYKPLNKHLARTKINSVIQYASFSAEQAKKVKETFLANMSHELRTPVNGIIGLTNLLRKTPLNEQQTSMIDLLEVSSESLLGVINDVLDIAKIDAGKFNIVRSSNNLHDLLRSVYGLLKFKADENNIEFLLGIASDVPVNLMIDSLRLNQVLMNLLSNAIKFTKRGFVKLDVSVVEKKDDQVQLKFIVADSGIGIPESRLSSVFESFEQAEENTASKYGGTGLGLTIVKRLVELKGGELKVKSIVGKGSVFSFVNWYAIAEKPKERTFRTEKTLESFENAVVLVAEDNLVNQFMLSKMLKDWRIEVDMVDNGQKVLEKLKLNEYDLILMDTHMPEMNGYETAKAIRANFDEPKRSIPIISLSAASFDYEQEEALVSGMNDVLSKPFQPQELHRKIKRLLKKPELVKDPV